VFQATSFIRFCMHVERQVIFVDFMPDKEFHPLFDRTSRKVNLKGCGTPAEIDERLKEKIEEYEYLRKKKRLAPRAARRRISDLKNLMFAGFGRRTIDEAIANPRGEVALTLIYGRENAKEILLERARKRIGSLAMRKRG
jgi:hypothetical protein